MEGVAEQSSCLSSGLLPTLPWFLWRRGSWGSLEKPEGRTHGLMKPDLQLPCPGNNRAKAWMVLAQAPPAPCLLLWSMPELTFHLPFTLWVTQRLSHCFRNWLCLDSVVEVFPQHCAEAGMWVDCGMLLLQSGEPLFSFFGWCFAFSIYNTRQSQMLKFTWTCPKTTKRSCSFHWQLIALVCRFCKRLTLSLASHGGQDGTGVRTDKCRNVSHVKLCACKSSQ